MTFVAAGSVRRHARSALEFVAVPNALGPRIAHANYRGPARGYRSVFGASVLVTWTAAPPAMAHGISAPHVEALAPRWPGSCRGSTGSVELSRLPQHTQHMVLEGKATTF